MYVLSNILDLLLILNKQKSPQDTEISLISFLPGWDFAFNELRLKVSMSVRRGENGLIIIMKPYWESLDKQ